MKLFAVWNKNYSRKNENNRIFVVGDNIETDIDQNFSADGFSASHVEVAPVFNTVADFDKYHLAINSLEKLKRLSKFEIARVNEHFGIDKIVQTEIEVAQIRAGHEAIDGERLKGARVYPVYCIHDTDGGGKQTVLGVFTSATDAHVAQQALSAAHDWSSPDGYTRHGTEVATVFMSVAKAVLGDKAPDPVTAVADRFSPKQRAFLGLK